MAIHKSFLGLSISHAMQLRNNEELTSPFFLKPSHICSLAFLIHHCHINNAYDYNKTKKSNIPAYILNSYKHPFFPETSVFSELLSFFHPSLIMVQLLAKCSNLNIHLIVFQVIFHLFLHIHTY